jgi:hypothetical protein
LRDFVTSTMPTYPKTQLFNRKSITGVRSVKILRTSHSPYSILLLKWPIRIITKAFAKPFCECAIMLVRLVCPQPLLFCSIALDASKQKIRVFICFFTDPIDMVSRIWGQSTRQKWGCALVNYLADIYGIMYRHKHFKYGFKV